jgi:hypothetical protein
MQDTTLSAEIAAFDTQIDALQNQIDAKEIEIDALEVLIDEKEAEIDQIKMALSQLEINYDAQTVASNNATKATWDEVYALIGQTAATTDNTTATENNTDATSTNTDKTGDNTTAVEDNTTKVENATDKVEDLSYSTDVASDKVDAAAQSADDASDALSGADSLADAASTTKDAISDLGEASVVAADKLAGGDGTGSSSDSSGTTTSSETSGILDLISSGVSYFTGGTDAGTVIGNLLARYIPKLVNTGVKYAIKKVSSNHDGTNCVEKSDSPLDDLLGLGSDETARVLKVGETVVPNYASDVKIQQTDEPFTTSIDSPNASNVSTNNGGDFNLDMGDLDISGIDSDELMSQLKSLKKDFADEVYSTINKHIKIGGYRNVKNSYI